MHAGMVLFYLYLGLSFSMNVSMKPAKARTAITTSAEVVPQQVETDTGASMLTTVMLMIEVSTMIANVLANCRMVMVTAEPCGISSSSSADMLIVTSGMSVRPKPNMKMQKYPIMKYGELSMPTVLSKIRESIVIANPMIAIVLPPYRSYNDPETKVMTESS